MRVSTLKLFDESISGTTTTWFTPSEMYDPLGKADQFTFSASVYNVTGTPTLNVQAEHCADGQNWINVGGTTPELSITVTSNQVFVRQRDGGNPVLLSFVRLKSWLSNAGTNPAWGCRLKLTATTRSF